MYCHDTNIDRPDFPYTCTRIIDLHTTSHMGGAIICAECAYFDILFFFFFFFTNR